MQVNTDSIAILTKQVLKSEIEALKLKPKTMKNLTSIDVMQNRIRELEGDDV
jgi:hypothetical protein